MRSNWKRWLFKLSVKSPVTAVGVILITVVTLLIVSYVSETNIYLEIDGTLMQRNVTDKEEVVILTDWIQEDWDKIQSDAQVIWFLERQGKRYTAQVTELIPSLDGIQVLIIPEQKDIQMFKVDTDSKMEVTVEIFITKQKIIESIF